MAEDLELELLDTDVRKWGRMKVGVSDYGAAGITVPTAAAGLYDATGKPIAWPSGVKELGYLTTDGITAGRSISASDTNMLQSKSAVRSDVESVTKTLKGVLGQASSGWANAMYEGIPVADWPANAEAAWLMKGDHAAYEAEYVLWLLSVDGVGTQARFRHELAYRCKITSLDDRVLNKTNAETFGITFGLYWDPVAGTDHLRAEDGPAYTTHLVSGG